MGRRCTHCLRHLARQASHLRPSLTVRRFYDDGYKEGYAHGRIHGLIEGRALGREKGFEMWEELGFYEGFALLWTAVLESQGTQEE